jgi:hypothetical protein
MKDGLDKSGAGRGWRMLPGWMLLVCLPAFSQMYKWTDAHGTVHYTDSPPPPAQ